MAYFAFDIYDRASPNGTRLVRLTAAEQGVELTFVLAEMGYGDSDGTITIHSDHAAATAANFARHNLVKVVAVRDDLSETKCGGFFLEDGDFVALSKAEKGGRLLTFRGPNTFYYLDRAILRESPFSTSPGALALNMRGGANVPGFWTWGADSDGREPGPIMVRGLEEGHDQPGNPLGDATWDFTRSVDSASNAWDELGDEWQLAWGSTILDMAILFIKSGGLYFRSGPDLDYHAYDADPSTDRSSATFAAGKVRFEAGVNIVTEVSRTIQGRIERSAVLVTGADATTAFVSGGSSPVPWVGSVDAGEVNNPARLAVIGQRNLDAREVRTESAFPLRHIVQDDELNGGYIPFVHYMPGDPVTIHTGNGDHDFTEFTIVVAAVRIVHDAAGNWFGVPDLGAQTLDAGSKAFEERANRIIRQGRAHTHPEMLCQSTDLFRGVASGSIKTNGDEEGWGRTNSVDGDSSAESHWSGTPLDAGVADMWFALDIGEMTLADAFRLRTATGTTDSPQNIATEARLYGSNDSGVWDALTHGSGKMASDPASNGWALVATHMSALTDPSDSGRTGFDPASYRYWLWKAISGGTSEWDINTLELWSSVGDSLLASRCGHHHGAHEIAYGAQTVHERLDELGEHDHGGAGGGRTWTPINEAYLVANVEYTSSQDITVEATSIPSSGVILVTGVLTGWFSSVNNGNSVRARNYGAADGQGQSAIVYGNTSRGASSFAIAPGGTNNRSLRYKVNRAAGTVAVHLMVNGYWS